MNLTLWRYVNDVTQLSINKERYWLTLTFLRQVLDHMTFRCFALRNISKPEMLVSSKAITLRM